MKNSLHLFTILCILSCNHLEGKPGMSESVKDSKRRGVFIREYVSDKPLVHIDDTINLKVKVAWLEKRWGYGSGPGNTLIIEGYQLIIQPEDKLDDNYSFTWTIGTSFNRNFRSCGYKCIMTDFDSLPKNRETWDIQQGRLLNSATSKKIIGNLTLYKK